MAIENPLWALLRVGARLGRRVWRPRKIDVTREVPLTLNGTPRLLVQGIDWIQHEARQTRVRLVYSLKPKRIKDSAVNLLLQLVRASGNGVARVSQGRNAIIVKCPSPSAYLVDRSWESIRAAASGDHLRRKPRRYGRGSWSTTELDQLLSQILRQGAKQWTPTYVNFRKVSRFSACGYEWDLLHEGLCNEWDKQLSFILCSGSKIPYNAWRMLRRSGFFESFASEVATHGYQVSMRVRWGGDSVFGEFSKRIRVRSLEDDVRFHLAWCPSQPFHARRTGAPSANLFFDSRVRMPKE